MLNVDTLIVHFLPLTGSWQSSGICFMCCRQKSKKSNLCGCNRKMVKSRTSHPKSWMPFWCSSARSGTFLRFFWPKYISDCVSFLYGLYLLCPFAFEVHYVKLIKSDILQTECLNNLLDDILNVTWRRNFLISFFLRPCGKDRSIVALRLHLETSSVEIDWWEQNWPISV